MIELKRERLVFSFPEVHPKARPTIDFQGTLRIPDDDRTYPLPPGPGSFPLRHVDDFFDNVPPRRVEHGGVMMPMYQSEATWLNFRTEWVEERMTPYPLAIKVGTGKIDAVSPKRVEVRKLERNGPEVRLLQPYANALRWLANP